MELKDRVCIVTGASKGLGRTIALAMSAEGAKVAINGRNETDLKTLAEEIEKKGREVFIAKADVSKSEEVNLMVDLVVKRFGRIDVLVNNAGGAMFTNHVFAEVTERSGIRLSIQTSKGHSCVARPWFPIWSSKAAV